MVNRRAQEQAFPTAKSYAPIFKRSEGCLQIAAGVPTPKVAIKIRILTQWLVAHCFKITTPCGQFEKSSLLCAPPSAFAPCSAVWFFSTPPLGAFSLPPPLPPPHDTLP